jgi:hypothetical protein
MRNALLGDISLAGDDSGRRLTRIGETARSQWLETGMSVSVTDSSSGLAKTVPSSIEESGSTRGCYRIAIATEQSKANGDSLTIPLKWPRRGDLNLCHAHHSAL